jgi:hypothetical protein
MWVCVVQWSDVQVFFCQALKGVEVFKSFVTQLGFTQVGWVAFVVLFLKVNCAYSFGLRWTVVNA